MTISLQQGGDLPLLFGPYRRIDLLRDEPRSLAYRAQHQSSLDPSTLFLPRGASQAQLEHMRRRFYARRAFQHPNVARLLEEDLQGPTPWYSTDLHEGIPLSFALQGLTAPPPSPAPEPHPLSDTLESAAGPGPSAPPPSRVHIRKPMPDELREQILRLGCELCGALGELHKADFFHGTLTADTVLLRPDQVPLLCDPGLWEPTPEEARADARCPPELLRGEPLGARADVFALGVLLFELFSGLRYGTHGARFPETHLWSLVDLPRELCRLVHRMVEPDPQARPANPGDCAEELAVFLGRARPQSRPRFGSVLERTAGRPGLLQQASELLFQEGSQGLWLQVDPRVDVTLLLDALAAQAVAREQRVHHAHPCPWGLPLGVFGMMLRYMEPPDYADGGVAPWEDLARVPSIARGAYLEAAHRHLAREPGLLVMERVDEQDELSELLLKRLLREGSGWRFLLTTTRPGSAPGGLSTLRVGPLEDQELMQLLRAALSSSRLPPGLFQVFRGGSNRDPWGIELQLASLVDRGLLERDEIGVWRAKVSGELTTSDLLPDTALLEERVGRLPPLALRLLGAAVLLQKAAPDGWLFELAEHDPSDPCGQEALDLLLRRRWLLKLPCGFVRLAASWVQGVVLARLGEAERRKMNLAAARWFGAVMQVWPQGRAALHLEQAGCIEESALVHERVGELAWGMGAPRDAGEHWRQALELTQQSGGAPPRRGRLRRRLALALATLGEPQKARALLALALEDLSEPKKGKFPWFQGEATEDTLREQVMAYTQLALLPFLSTSERLHAAGRAMQLAEPLQPPPHSLPLAQGVLEDLLELLPLGRRASPIQPEAWRKLARRATPPQETLRWVRRGQLHLQHGRWAQAEQDLRRAASRSVRLRAQALWLQATTALALALFLQGEFDQCTELSASFERGAPDESDAPWLRRCVEAELCLQRGQPEGALAALEGVLPPALAPRARGLRALALRHLGRPLEAQAEAERAVPPRPTILDAESLFSAYQALQGAPGAAPGAAAPHLAALRTLAESAPVLSPRVGLLELGSGQGRQRPEALLEEARRMELPYTIAMALQQVGRQAGAKEAEGALREAELLLNRLRA
ncbi:MAG: protein kinase [Polyangiaceae bacterium]|jgi:tetratricopeptide (TPR) repeat protein|nr:protein kinase [Polyangiaceae bacterium]